MNDLSGAHAHPLDALFRPRSIAVVGASASPAKLGYQMLHALGSFPGRLYPINPNATSIAGHTVHPRLTDVAAPIDLAVLVVSAQATPAALQDCAAAGVRAALICAGGFAEAGADGAALQARITGLAREAGIRVLGPNTSGFINPRAGVLASFVPAAAAIRPGPIAIVAQSGGVNHALAFLAHNDGAGLSLGVGLGNAIDIGFVDLLDYLAADEQTRAIVLHIEGVADGRALFDALERITLHKPVVALKLGRADVGDFARSHTGALIGNWALTRSALTQAGAVVVDDTSELIDAARALAAVRLAPSSDPGVGIVTGQAGPGLLIADLLSASRVRVPPLAAATRERLSALLPPLTMQTNPVDTSRPDQSLGQVLSIVGSDPEVDAMLAYLLHEPDAVDPAAALRELRDTATAPMPILFATGGPQTELVTIVNNLEAAGVPVYLSPERSARALRALIADSRAAARRATGRVDAVTHPRSRLGPAPLDEHAAKTLLESIGIRTPRRRVCMDRSAAHAALAELSRSGRPIVAKVLDAAITHKSDAGGVYLNIRTAAELDPALDGIAQLAPDGQARCLLEEMAPPGVELIVGGTRDPAFGPTVLLGLGGVTVEALGDVALRLAPLSAADAAEMLDDLAGRGLLDGYRGLPQVDRDELIAVLLAVGHLLVAHPEIAELDINPLRATRDGLLALDALVILAA